MPTDDTLDIEVHELEEVLKRGGEGPGGFEDWALMGVEVLPASAQQAEAKKEE